jgi:hypothetical protein
MLQDMDSRAFTGIDSVKGDMLDRLEQSEICIRSVTVFGIAMLIIEHHPMCSICFRYNPMNIMIQTSQDVHSMKERS